MKAWRRIVHYSIGILLAVMLGVVLGRISLFQETTFALGSIPLFQETPYAKTRLSASQVAGYLGYGAALFLFWLAGCHTALKIPKNKGKGRMALRRTIPPLVTLAVVSAGYKVFLLPDSSLLDLIGKEVYNRIFVVGIVIAASWLTLECFIQSARLLKTSDGQGKKGDSSDDKKQDSPFLLINPDAQEK